MHSKAFKMCAGGSSFFEKGTTAIIQKLEKRPKTGMRDWGDQQMVDYWGGCVVAVDAPESGV